MPDPPCTFTQRTDPHQLTAQIYLSQSSADAAAAAANDDDTTINNNNFIIYNQIIKITFINKWWVAQNYVKQRACGREHDNKQPGSKQQEMYLAEQDSIFQSES